MQLLNMSEIQVVSGGRYYSENLKNAASTAGMGSALINGAVCAFACHSSGGVGLYSGLFVTSTVMMSSYVLGYALGYLFVFQDHNPIVEPIFI